MMRKHVREAPRSPPGPDLEENLALTSNCVPPLPPLQTKPIVSGHRQGRRRRCEQEGKKARNHDRLLLRIRGSRKKITSEPGTCFNRFASASVFYESTTTWHLGHGASPIHPRTERSRSTPLVLRLSGAYPQSGAFSRQSASAPLGDLKRSR